VKKDGQVILRRMLPTFIDEVQRLPELLAQVQVIVDGN